MTELTAIATIGIGTFITFVGKEVFVHTKRLAPFGIALGAAGLSAAPRSVPRAVGSVRVASAGADAGEVSVAGAAVDGVVAGELRVAVFDMGWGPLLEGVHMHAMSPFR